MQRRVSFWSGINLSWTVFLGALTVVCCGSLSFYVWETPAIKSALHFPLWAGLILHGIWVGWRSDKINAIDVRAAEYFALFHAMLAFGAITIWLLRVVLFGQKISYLSCAGAIALMVLSWSVCMLIGLVVYDIVHKTVTPA
ncbi:MAG TPA: hypothetical protein VEA59_02360 [Patescibacteria group bacterium]|nr:hypothetical protein [Patescibacteria group bacterium]